MNQFLENLKPIAQHKWLLLDTNFLIEARREPKLYIELRNFFSDNKIPLITNDLVIGEFLVGIKSVEEYKKKKIFLENLLDTSLTITDDVTNILIEKVAPLYEENRGKSQIIDLYLAATCIKFCSGVLLMTKNHKDFLPKLFDLKYLLPIEGEYNRSIYGFYQYSEDKIISALDKLAIK